MLRDHLRRLIAHSSVSSRPMTDLAQELADAHRRQGFDVTIDADPERPGKANVIARVGPRGRGGLTLSGHLDVVPTEGQPWTSDPFTLTERGDRWLGRGVADMKGFIASTLTALERIDIRNLTRELALIWTHDEEVGCVGSARLASGWTDDPLPSDCLIGEPTDFRVLHMHPGHCVVRVTLHGKAAHTSLPELGDNAVVHAAHAILALDHLSATLRAEHHDLPGAERPWVVLAVGPVHGGTAVNVVPDEVTLSLGLRQLPRVTPESVVERIVSALAGLPGDPKVVLERVSPALWTPLGEDWDTHLAQHARHHIPGAAPFATDGGNLARLGLRPLVFGPGAIDVAHQADEWVTSADLSRAADILEQLILARAG